MRSSLGQFSARIAVLGLMEEGQEVGFTACGLEVLPTSHGCEESLDGKISITLTCGRRIDSRGWETEGGTENQTLTPTPLLI
jgi:hypothetical protein